MCIRDSPTDDAFFGNPPALKNASMVAFGMTRRGGRSAADVAQAGSHVARGHVGLVAAHVEQGELAQPRHWLERAVHAAHAAAGLDDLAALGADARAALDGLADAFLRRVARLAHESRRKVVLDDRGRDRLGDAWLRGFLEQCARSLPPPHLRALRAGLATLEVDALLGAKHRRAALGGRIAALRDIFGDADDAAAALARSLGALHDLNGQRRRALLDAFAGLAPPDDANARRFAAATEEHTLAALDVHHDPRRLDWSLRELPRIAKNLRGAISALPASWEGKIVVEAAGAAETGVKSWWRGRKAQRTTVPLPRAGVELPVLGLSLIHI